MKLEFIGATHEVTGSCYLLTACGVSMLIDCGTEQGTNFYENVPLPIAAGKVDHVLLTHAHIDHSGMLPKLAHDGFTGQIHTTEATSDLCAVMLRDAAHIQEFEAEWRNRKAKRSGGEQYVPIYTTEDAESAIALFTPHPYLETFEIAPGIRVRFVDAGHLLGSASIEIWITEDGTEKKIVFSGDIGNVNQPIIRDPDYLDEADYVVMESTYGDRNHSAVRPDYVKDLAAIMQRTFDRGGNVVIPSFAVGRTQEMLYFLREIHEKHLVSGHGYKVYVDSPMAVQATSIFRENGMDCYDEDTMALLQAGVNPIVFDGLCTCVTSDESKAINFDKEPKVILSTSGMCEAGRIKHHLKHNLWRRESTVLFVGYQAANTVGRAIVDGAKSVRLFGETIEVNAEIATLVGMSGHADHDGLIKWIEHYAQKPGKVFVTHGDPEVCEKFTNELKSRGYDAFAPYSGTIFDLASGQIEYAAPAVPVQHSYAAERADNMFSRLLAAGKRLLTVIEHNRGGSSKDLARFASQVESLCDKWDK